MDCATSNLSLHSALQHETARHQALGWGREQGGRGDEWKLKITPPWRGSLETTRRSFNRDFLLALTADFKKHGAAAIAKVRKYQPAAYMKICALLVPREMKLEHSGGVKALTD